MPFQTQNRGVKGWAVNAVFVAVGSNNAALPRRVLTVKSTWASTSYNPQSSTATRTYPTDKNGQFVITSPASTSYVGGTSTLTLVSVASAGMTWSPALSTTLTTHKWQSAAPGKKSP